MLQKRVKWQYPNRNISTEDVVVVREDGVVPTQWPLARVTGIHAGKDGIIRVVDIRTHKGHYRRPVHKLAVLLPHDTEQ